MRDVNIAFKAKEYKVIVTIDKTKIDTEVVKSTLLAMRDNAIVQKTRWLKVRVRTMIHEVEAVQQWIRSRRVENRMQKRGLIDGVGLITHALFGLATDGEVEEVRQRVVENRHALQKITTFQEEQLAVVNVTYAAVMANRMAITMNKNRLDNLFYMNDLAEEAHEQVMHLTKTMNHLMRLEDDLNQGILSERLLPYSDIVSLPKERNEVWLPAEWYYHWSMVAKVPNTLGTYFVTLPLISMEEVRGYELAAYPMEMGGEYVVIEVAQLTTLNTATGATSEPYGCVGEGPKVCNVGIRRTGSCAGALVLGEGLEDTCHARTKVPLTRNYFPLSTGEGVLVVDKGKTVRERCQNEPIEERLVTTGTWRVRWRPGCRVEFGGVTITAPKLAIGQRRVRAWKQPDAKLNVTHITSQAGLPPMVPLKNIHLYIPPALNDIVWTVHTWEGTLSKFGQSF
jgi:hypothetical protein